MSAIFEQTVMLPEEDGPGAQLIARGDEFYARYETPDGYTAVYDTALDRWCYASLADGEFVSSGIPVDRPPDPGLPRHLKEAPEVHDSKLDDRFRQSRPPEAAAKPIPEVYGPNKGLLDGRQCQQGAVRGLTVLINFQDVETTVTADEVAAMLNADGYKAHGNYCSVREYYRQVSTGALDYENTVVGPITLSKKRRHYVNTLLAAEALDRVVELGIDLSQFDAKDEGYVDAVSFMYAGKTIWEGNLWPHNSHVSWRHDGYRANLYQITSLGLRSSDLRIGTFCHESGHMLCRFPDLYDYGRRDGDFERSAGLGRYCLMSFGDSTDDRRTPAPVCAYLRYLAGWCTKVVSLKKKGAYQLRHGEYDTAYIYPRSKKEYFLLENRSQLGLDAHLPAGGLAVYHCDIAGSNERQQGSWMRHYQCALLQADGRMDLERNGNGGDAADLYGPIAGEALSAGTTPSTRWWNGVNSRLRVTDISEPGAVISLRIV